MKPDYAKVAEVQAEQDYSWCAEVLPRLVPAGWRVLDRLEDGIKYHHRMKRLLAILSVSRELDGKRWLHLSVSHAERLPRWSELVEVKELFIGVERAAYKVIPARSRHVNIHPNVLHLWSCLDGDPLPDFTRGTGSL